MDRQKIEGGFKKTDGVIKENAGQMVGNRHPENEGKTPAGQIRGGKEDPLDAVRDVVNNEK